MQYTLLFPHGIRTRCDLGFLTCRFCVSLNHKDDGKKKIYKTELTKIRYKNQVLCKYRVDPQRVGLTLIAELTWSNLGLKKSFK